MIDIHNVKLCTPVKLQGQVTAINKTVSVAVHRELVREFVLTVNSRDGSSYSYDCFFHCGPNDLSVGDTIYIDGSVLSRGRGVPRIISVMRYRRTCPIIL